MPYPSPAQLAAARTDGCRPIQLSSLEEAFVLIPLAHKPEERQQQKPFLVIKLERMRDAREMLKILYVYACDGSINAINLQQVEDAFRLDGILVEMKHSLTALFRSHPDLKEETPMEVFGLCEEEPDDRGLMDREDYDEGLIRYLSLNTAPRVFYMLYEARAKMREICRAICKSNISRSVRKGINTLRAGENKEEVKEEMGEIKELQALADSLLGPDGKGVVPRETLREIQLDASTTLHCLQQLQLQHIPRSLAKIQKRRNQELVMPHPSTPRPRLHEPEPERFGRFLNLYLGELSF